MATLREMIFGRRKGEREPLEPWEVPLDWDLWRVKDQLVRWRKEAWTIGKQRLLHGFEAEMDAYTRFTEKIDPNGLNSHWLDMCRRFLDQLSEHHDVPGDIIEGVREYLGMPARHRRVMIANRIKDRMSEIGSYIANIDDDVIIQWRRMQVCVTSDSEYPPWSFFPRTCFPDPGEIEDIFQKMEERMRELTVREEEQSLRSSQSRTEELNVSMDQERKALLEECAQLRISRAALEERCEHNGKVIMDMEQAKKGLQEENTQLRISKAVLEDRCERNDKLMACMEQEIKSLKGELADMRHALCCRYHQSSPHEGPTSQVNGFPEDVIAAMGFSDNAAKEESIVDSGPVSNVSNCENSWEHVSATSLRSWISVGTSTAQCFVEKSVFKAASVEATYYLPVEQLMKGSRVLAEDGQTTLEVARTPERFETDRVVELRTDAATLCVTPDHRVPVLDELSARRDVQARDLKAGDVVMEDGEATELTSAVEKILPEKVSVWKISFTPDLPVGVFMPPSAISSKGNAQKALRRSGMNRRGKPGTANDAQSAVPDTADGDSELPEVCRVYHEPS